MIIYQKRNSSRKEQKSEIFFRLSKYDDHHSPIFIRRLQSQDGKQNYSISVRISKFIIDSVLERRIPSRQPRGSPNNFESLEERKLDSFQYKVEWIRKAVSLHKESLD